MRTLKLVLALALVSCAPTYAATLTGTVRDAQTGDAVVGANVYLDDTGLGAVADADGAFRIAGVSPGTYTVTASHVGYTVAKRSVAVSQGVVTAELSLEPEILRGQTVVVTASRAKERETPSAFSNLSRQDIERRYWAQDVPMVLQTMPSAHAYSDAGNGVGYSYLSIRGFNQKRINVLINGIPHNGPTSHEVYWIDMPDLLANARDVQIQRGVGSSLHGSSALGGSVNIVTSNFSTQPSVSFHTGAGSYSTRKYSFAYNSGLVAENYVMYGRFSRITSDGYRDQSWTKLWSYFLGVARYDENMTTKIHVYGGPEETHLSYYGIAKEYLDGDITGDARADRRYNPLDYEDETDNFNQPHYEIHNDWQATDRLLVSNIFYTIKGRGDYDQFRRGRSLAEFRLPSFTVTEPDLYETSWYDLDGAGQPVRDGDGRYTIVRRTTSMAGFPG